MPETRSKVYLPSARNVQSALGLANFLSKANLEPGGITDHENPQSIGMIGNAVNNRKSDLIRASPNEINVIDDNPYVRPPIIPGRSGIFGDKDPYAISVEHRKRASPALDTKPERLIEGKHRIQISANNLNDTLRIGFCSRRGEGLRSIRKRVVWIALDAPRFARPSGSQMPWHQGVNFDSPSSLDASPRNAQASSQWTSQTSPCHVSYPGVFLITSSIVAWSSPWDVSP